MQAEQTMPEETEGGQGGARNPERSQKASQQDLSPEGGLGPLETGTLYTYPTSRLSPESQEVAGSHMHVCVSVHVHIYLHACILEQDVCEAQGSHVQRGVGWTCGTHLGLPHQVMALIPEGHALGDCSEHVDICLRS